MRPLSKAFNIYQYDIYPHISHLRGSTRFLHMFRKFLLRDVEEVDGSADDIFSYEWDNLLVLDCCRHDLYEEVNGETGYRISHGSATPEFIEKTFSKGDFSDIVYVTGNPHFYKDIFKELTGRDVEDIFHAVYNTYETDWDEENGVVMPESLVRDARNARKMFPDKKIIVHFMQPHVPFVKSELHQPVNNPVDQDGSDEKLGEPPRAERGELSQETVWRHYRENLEFVMPYVEELGEELEGKTVVTSDHGQLMGENGVYGHPKGYGHKVLRKVPWEVIDD